MLRLTNRTLKNSRVSFQTLAPEVQDKSMIAQYSAENAGAIIDFYLPEIKSEDDSENHAGSSLRLDTTEAIQQNDPPTKKLRVRPSTESKKFLCVISEIIILNELSGYLVRLAPPEDNKDLSYDRKLERIHKYPNIQFAFDPIGMRFVQEECSLERLERLQRIITLNNSRMPS